MEKVKGDFSKEMTVVASMCDETSVMSIPAILDMFQDTAGVHAAMIGTGVLRLEEMGMFWVISKVRIVINRRPMVGENFSTNTWIQPAERIICERDNSITAEDGEVLAYGRYIWAVLRREDARPVRMSEFYPEPEETVAAPDTEPFRRVSKKFEDAETLGSYTIRSVDIDRGGHMNNVNYVRAMLGCFTCSELAEMDIRELDMQFLLQCYEGETIRFVKRKSDTALMEIGAFNGEGRVCFTAALL